MPVHTLGLFSEVPRTLRQLIEVASRGRRGENSRDRRRRGLADLDTTLRELLGVQLLQIRTRRDARTRHAHVNWPGATANRNFPLGLAFLFQDGRRKDFIVLLEQFKEQDYQKSVRQSTSGQC